MACETQISVIIPTHNGAATLESCLRAIRSSSYVPHEIIVVDDASSDQSAAIAERYGCRVIRQSANIGAARAKNAGAQNATGDILVFTDDDVMLAPDLLGRVEAIFNSALVSGAVGLFTPEIPFDDFASQYKNLWMLYTFVNLPRDRIGVFYTSIAAIRRKIFQTLGGFDPNYRGASIAEDTEFGQRAWGAGFRIVLDSNMRATHHKHYTLQRVLGTDYTRARALTLMRLRKIGQPFFTSVPWYYQFAVPVIFLAFAALTLGLGLGNWVLGSAGLVLFGAFYFLFLPWFVYLFHERGWRFGVYAALFQPFDVVTVSAGMVAGLIDFLRGIQY